jgi:4-hydroxy 2-oxovalerate aldolase
MLTHIDCTLRDGGYYNNWDFDQDLIAEYLIAMHQSQIDYVELGFRSILNSEFKGALAYTTDAFISSLKIPKGLKIGVMVNAAEIITYKKGIDQAVNLLFADSKYSKVNLVRIASHPDKLIDCLPIVNALKKKGYLVGLNAMYVAEKNEAELKKISQIVTSSNVDIFYLADSKGSLESNSIEKLVKNIRYSWQGPLGIHAHNNLGRALINTMEAIRLGIEWVDTTVTGMGRGPGNAETEYLLIEQKIQNKKNINLNPILNLIEHHFKEMKARYQWGCNSFYYIAGKYNIHPNYIQNILGDSRYDVTEILYALQKLKDNNLKNSKLSNSLKEKNINTKNLNPIKEFKNKEILIVGPGNSTNRHKDAIERYILKFSPIVIVLNTNFVIDSKFIDFVAVCHPFRLISEAHKYKKVKCRIIMPTSAINNLSEFQGNSNKILNFDHIIKTNKFEFHSTYVVTPNSLAIGYALAMVTSGKAKRISLVGFDGHGLEDARTKDTDELFTTYNKCTQSLHIVSLTPTSYRILSESIYAL